jgi:hypothetical protein
MRVGQVWSNGVDTQATADEPVGAANERRTVGDQQPVRTDSDDRAPSAAVNEASVPVVAEGELPANRSANPAPEVEDAAPRTAADRHQDKAQPGRRRVRLRPAGFAWLTDGPWSVVALGALVLGRRRPQPGDHAAQAAVRVPTLRPRRDARPQVTGD